ncbi:glycosyltransferase family 4 protein [Mucilaginibacter paludis]|nr:glycosyltransferase family 4 protein [Mucilaginibacter paludis]
MHKPETLVILSPGFPVNEEDSVCLPLQQIFIRSLANLYPKLNIVVLAFEYPFAKKTYWWFGIQVIAFGGQNKNRLYRLLNWVRVWQQLRKLKKQNHVIGLLSFWVDECAFIGHYFARRHHLKHFSWILGQDAKAGNRYFKLIRFRPQSLIAISDFTRKLVHKNYGVMPAHTITSGIDTGMFMPYNGIRDIDILGAGSLIALKQYDMFIDVVKAVARQMPNVRAAICGKGPEKEKLLQLIAQNNLEKNIVLLYEVPHTQVVALMQRSRVFLHPSAYEGFSAVMLEALYAGAQVISFVKPMDQSFDHHYVVNDTEQMQKKALAILDDRDCDHEPVLAYPIQQVASSIMQLYR